MLSTRGGTRRRPIQLRRGRRDTGIVLICYFRVASGRPPAEPGHDLIGDRPQRVGPVLGGGLARVTGPEQDHLVPLPGGLAAEVHHELVHAHGAAYRPAPSPHEHLGHAERAARDAVRVAERHQPERAGAGAAGDVPVAVRDPGASRAGRRAAWTARTRRRPSAPGRTRSAAASAWLACWPGAALRDWHLPAP